MHSCVHTHTHTSSSVLVKLEKSQNCSALSPATDVGCGVCSPVPLGAWGVGGVGKSWEDPSDSLAPGQLWPVIALSRSAALIVPMEQSCVPSWPSTFFSTPAAPASTAVWALSTLSAALVESLVEASGVWQQVQFTWLRPRKGCLPQVWGRWGNWRFLGSAFSKLDCIEAPFFS